MKNKKNKNSAPPEPIEIFVSFPWTKRGEVTVGVREDERWVFLRDRITRVIEECKRRVDQMPGKYKLHIRLNRLRGRQGMNLLSTLRERISRADVLVIDIGETNPNVMIEVGIGVALCKSESGALFILKPKSVDWPSNLQGLIYCNYDQSLQKGLEDQAGFRGALRTQILKVARQRNMLGSPKHGLVEVEGEEPERKRRAAESKRS